MAVCDTLRNAAPGGCSSTFTITDSNDLGKADCSAVATDTCVACKSGYVWDAGFRKCVLGCKQTAEACAGSVISSNCCATDTQGRNLYCSKGLDGTGFVVNLIPGQGYCCPAGRYWDDNIGACRPTALCRDFECASSLTAPLSYLTQNKLYFLGKSQSLNSCVIATKPYRDSCVSNANLGPTIVRVYGPIHVLDSAGNRVT